MQRSLVITTVAGMLLASSFAYAGWGWGGGWCMNGYGQSASTQQILSFQKETLTLREDLTEKQLEFQDEISKDLPDGKRIAALRKEINDLESQLQTIGDKSGVGNWSMGEGMGYRRMMYSGCRCGRYGW